MKKVIIFIILFFIPITLFSIEFDDSTQRGKLRHWNLNENGGISANDTVSGDTITLTATSWVTGKYGSGIRTYGNSKASYAVTKVNTSFGLTSISSFTIGFWIYYTSYPAGTELYFRLAPNTYSCYPHYTHSSKEFGFLVWQEHVNNFADTNIQITSGVWHHIDYTFDSNDKVALYIDTVMVSSIAVADAGVNSHVGNDSVVATLFNDQTPFASSGDIIYDDFYVVNYAMSQQEIQALVNDAPTVTLNPDDNEIILMQ